MVMRQKRKVRIYDEWFVWKRQNDLDVRDVQPHKLSI